MDLTLTPGTVIADKYRVSRKLGEGGMGIVVAADHLHLPTQVAIKFLKHQASYELLERFSREAKALAQLRSEHVIRILDVGTLPSGEPYIVMELLEGQDLAAMVRARGRLPVVEAIDYFLQACLALAEAHAIGIVHRDIKPANLFLAAQGDGRHLIKVLDFGISKVNAIAKGPATAITNTGQFLGSPHYMSPEQLKSTRDVDMRADIWSLGVSLHRLIAGTNAFDADSVAELVMVILTRQAPRLRELVPDAPERLDHVIAKCLEREPANRFQNVAELANALAPMGPPHAHAYAARIASLVHRTGQSSPVLAPVEPVMPGTRTSANEASGSGVHATLAPTLDATRGPTGYGAAGRAGPQDATAHHPGSATTTTTRRRALAAIAGGGVLVLAAGSLGVWSMAGSDGGEEDEGNETDDSRSVDDKRKKPPNKDKKAGDDEAVSARAPVLALDTKGAHFDLAPELAALVERAHGGPLRLYDALFFEARSQFVVESKKGGDLVRYAVEKRELGPSEPFKLTSSSRLDNLLIDRSILDFSVVGKLAGDAPRRLGKSADQVYSVSLHRISSGVVWAVALKSGESQRYTLSGEPVR
jgi:eukaryotic-like serine/threonine-protein kinase